MQPEDVHSTYAEVSLLINDHNYKPNTNLSEGIKNFVDWYMEYYEINIT